MDQPYDKLLKCIVVGDVNVGKSSFCLNLTNKYVPIDYQTTIGVDFFVKILNLNNNNIKLIIWDTAGLEQFKSITRTYYRGSNLVFLFFDLSNINSFYNLKSWQSEVENECGGEIIKICVGNKNDLSMLVNECDILEYCVKNNMNYISTNCRNDNVEDKLKKVLDTHIIPKYNFEINDKKTKNKKSLKNSHCCNIL